MSKKIVVEINSVTGEVQVDAQGFDLERGKCTGEKATAFIEEALGATVSRQYKPDVEGGQARRAVRSVDRQSQG